jgi:hypothetical protein
MAGFLSISLATSIDLIIPITTEHGHIIHFWPPCVRVMRRTIRVSVRTRTIGMHRGNFDLIDQQILIIRAEIWDFEWAKYNKILILFD